MPTANFLLGVTIYAVAINMTGFFAFAWDKYCAQNQLWRVSEQTLLSLAFFGGSVGAVVGQQTLRHKTRKQPFVSNLRLIIVLQVILLLLLSFPQGRSALWFLVLQILRLISSI